MPFKCNQMDKFKTFILGCVIGGAIIALLIWRSCSDKVPNPLPEKPKEVPTVEQIKIDSGAVQKVKDSIQGVVILYKKEAEQYKAQLLQYQNKYNDLASDYNALLDELPKDNPLAVELKNKYSQLEQTSKNKDAACRDAVQSLSNQIETQKSLIEVQDITEAALRTSLRASVRYSDDLKKYIDNSKPTNKLFVGASVLGRKENWISGAGLSVGLLSKKGNVYEAGAFTLNNTIYGQFSVKKIISFKKKK